MERGVESQFDGSRAHEEIVKNIEQVDEPKISMLRRVGNAVAIGAIAAVSLVAGLKSGSNNNDVHHMQVFPGKISGTGESASLLNDVSQTPQDALAESNEEADIGIGQVVDVVEPTEEEDDAYTAIYTDFGQESSLNVPRLREVIHFRGRQLFKPEQREHPDINSFTIYNTTQYPVDLRFFSYSLHAARSWLNYVQTHQGGQVNIGGYLETKARPQAVPHVFIMTNRFPDTLNREYYSKATTRKYPDYLSAVFLVRENPYDTYDGPFKTGLPFWKRGIATEVCNSLIDFYDTKAALGGSAILESQREYWEKPDSQAGLDTTAHEQACNAIGGIVTSIYEGGQTQLEIVRQAWPKTSVGLTDTPVMDLSITDTQIPEFFDLKKKALRRENYIITHKGSLLPTVEWYRQNEGY